MVVQRSILLLQRITVPDTIVPYGTKQMYGTEVWNPTYGSLKRFENQKTDDRCLTLVAYDLHHEVGRHDCGLFQEIVLSRSRPASLCKAIRRPIR